MHLSETRHNKKNDCRLSRTQVNTALASVFHDTLQRMTLLQHHWAGKGTRGTAQFSGKAINEILHTPHFVNKINEEASRQFLQRLLDR